jgi:hypothetical protein
MKVNKKYKDSVFRNLFNDKEKLLELYNAIYETNYKDAQAITINTLEDVLYIGMKNDISFMIDDTLVLIEHQSTINENMPLRMGMYLFRIYEKITKSDRFKKHSIEIPEPKFIVLYNGKEEYPEKATLKLSALFKKKNGRKKVIDLEVIVLNINKGYNHEIMRKCKTLADYTDFIAKVREYEEKHVLEEDIESAIKYCIDNNILKEYLEQNISEAKNMLMGEFNLDEYKEVVREEAIEEGMKKGIEKGIEKGIAKGQNYVLKLMEQGLSSEEIKKKIKKMPQKKH